MSRTGKRDGEEDRQGVGHNPSRVKAELKNRTQKKKQGYTEYENIPLERTYERNKLGKKCGRTNPLTDEAEALTYK